MKAIKCYIEKMLMEYEQKAEFSALSKSDLDSISYLCDLEAKVIKTCKMIHGEPDTNYDDEVQDVPLSRVR